MKILFVFYNCGSGLSFHGGIALLNALAKKEGHEVKLLHFHEKFIKDTDDFLPMVKEYNPDIIAFTSTDFEFEKVRFITKKIKRAFPPNTKPLMVLGGKAAVEIATKDPSYLLWDIYFTGEGEIPWVELLQRYDAGRSITDIWGTWAKTNTGLVKNRLGYIITKLDSLPFPDFDIFETSKIIESKGGWMNIQFSRGCPFNCTFCYTTADKYLLFDKRNGEDRYGMENYLRNVSIDYAMRYMESLCQNFPEIKVFNLDDELPIAVDRQNNWWFNFCKEYKSRIYSKYGVEFVANGRIDLMTEDEIRAMVDAGCREVRLGFESGSQRIRDKILDKHITAEKMKEVYGLCDKHGLRASSFTMIGIPTETEYDIWQTIKMTAELKPFLIRLTFCYPFENTKLWAYCEMTKTIIKERLYQQSGYFEETVFKLPISEQRLMTYKFLFPWFANIELYPHDMEIVERYSNAIDNFSFENFKDINVIQRMKTMDSILSNAMGDIEHFCYHPNGYIQCKNKVIK